jgi:hypothetical protein
MRKKILGNSMAGNGQAYRLLLEPCESNRMPWGTMRQRVKLRFPKKLLAAGITGL